MCWGNGGKMKSPEDIWLEIASKNDTNGLNSSNLNVI
jgi:hypothetical protein